MNDDTHTNSKQNPVVKILLTFVILLFVGVGSYSLYKVFIKKPSPSENLMPINTNPAVTKIAENLVATPPLSPTSYISASVTVPKTPTINPNITASPFPATTTPSKTPSITPTFKPSNTPIPTTTLQHTTTISLSPTPASHLPDAGFSTPTTLLLILGVILILPLISVF